MAPPLPRAARVVASCLSLALASCGSSAGSIAPSGEPSPAASDDTADEPSVAATASIGPDLLADWTVATIELGGGPDMPTAAFDSLWVLAVDGPLMNDGTEPAVHRIDPATNQVVASVPLPGRVCQGIGASPEAIWACGPDGLVRIDPRANAVVATVALDAALAVTRIAYGDGSIWAFATATVGPDLVVRVDPATNAVVATIELGQAAGSLAYGFGALWVTSPAADALLRIDPATNAVETWTEGVETPGLVVVGPDALWVSLHAEHGVTPDPSEPAVVRIDPVTGDVLASVVIGGGLGDEGGIAATTDAIWIRSPDPWLVRVDPVTNAVVDVVDTRSGPGDVTMAFDSVWVTWERGEILRLRP